VLLIWSADRFSVNSQSANEEQTDKKLLRPKSVPGQILVRFKKDSEIVKLTPRFGTHAQIDVADANRQIPIMVERLAVGAEIVSGLRLARVAPDDLELSLALLKARSDVLYAEPNYLRFKSVAPNDPRYTEQWGLQNTGQFSGVAGADIDAEQAWNSTTGNRNVVVAVIDEGIDVSHQDLHANVWQNPGETPGNNIDDDGNGFTDDINGYDFFHNDATVYDGPGTNPDGSTIDAHGTHVAGIVGAVGNNGIGSSGVNWEVSLMSLKFLGPDGGSVADAVRASNYAKSMLELWISSAGTKGANVHVLNNSYGGGGFSQAELDAIKALNSANILFVAAAGNESEDNDAIPSYPASYDVPNVISVASTTRREQLSNFSNKGSLSVHLGAPGSEIVSTMPGNLYGFLSGTSMASPHVAGTAALVLALHPTFSSTRVRAAILFGTDPISALDNITITGGRLNAAKALLNASDTDTTAPSVISNLHTTFQDDRLVTLQWTAPGDDGNNGQASLYEIRFADQTASSPILLAFKKPAVAGSAESLTLNIPFRHPSGSFVIQTIDNAGNKSDSTVPVSVSPTDLADPYSVTTSAASALSTGGQHLFVQNDDSIVSQSLPFSFPHFDHFYSFVSVSTNGTLYLGNGPFFDSTSRSQTLNRRLLVAAAWDDLDLRTCFRADSDIYRVSPDQDRVIFRWQGVEFSAVQCSDAPATPKAVNFEIELRRDGTIQMRYGENTPLHPVVGIGGGEPEGYVVPSHTSEESPLNLTNAQTLTYTLRSLPKIADLALSSTVVPAISTQGQSTTFNVVATNLGPSRVSGVVLTDTIPNGSTLTSCTSTVGTCQSIAANKFQVNLGLLDVAATATITVVIEPTASSSTPFFNAATISGRLSDPNQNNNDTSIATNLVNSNFNPQTGLIGVGTGALHSFAIRSDGIGLGFGWGAFGQIGDGGASDKRVAVRINGISSLMQIEGGTSHSIARRSDGSVWTWGRNEKGQLGLGTTTDVRLPTKVNGITNATKVAGGGHYSLVLLADGTVWGWGDNSQGQLGDGTKIDRTTPVKVNGLTGVVSIAAGTNHSLAVKTDGTVWSWGGNDHGQLGEPPSTGRTAPAQVAGLSNIMSVAAGDEFGFSNGQTVDIISYSCALKSDGTVWTWGSNWRGQLGNGNMIDRPTPGMVANLSGVTALTAGGFHVLALRNDGTVWAWGGNFDGQLGDGSITDRTSPVKVLWLTGITAIAAGSQHSLALRQDGHVFAWGSNSLGQTGSGQVGLLQNYPFEITKQVAEPPPIGVLAAPTFSPDGGTYVGPQNVTISHAFDNLAVTSLVTGGTHVAARLSNGETWGWGSNFVYQLGIDPGAPNPDPAKLTVKIPVKVTAFDGFSRIAGDNTHNVGLKADGTVWTWGGNARGELGYSTTNSMANLQPAQVPGLSGIVEVAAGSSLGSFDQSRTMVLRNDGTVWYWGFGPLNGDDVQSRITPTQVTALSGIIGIATGNASFAIKNDGSVWAWGANVSGQLGDGTHFNTRSTPAPVIGISNISSVVAGGGHTVALKPNGTVWVWGNNDFGQLGLGVQSGDQLTPIQVPSLSGVIAIAAGANFTFALKSDGTVWACGNNGSGALGDGNFSNHNVFTKIPGLNSITSIAAGMEFGVAQRSDGKIFTWGRNEWGQIGDGTVDTQPLATLMSQLNGGVVIHYTTNGADPTENDPEINSGESVLVNQNLTLKARAFKINWSSSATKTGTYQLTTPSVLQLSQTSVAASEGTNALVVNVSRSGDLSAISSVDYETGDSAGANKCDVINGHASERCDYLITRGRLTFGVGETSKNISVPITDDAYAEGTETFSINLSNPIAAVLTGPATATLTINDNDAVNGVNPINDAGFFVRQHYLDFLNREPDPSGFAFWTNEITSCGMNASCVELKRINVSAAFFLSIEFQETGYLVYRIYRTAFGDITGTPAPVRLAGFLRDTQQIGQGVQVGSGNWEAVLEANKQAYALQFVQRPEFLSAYPNALTADQFVTLLNTNAGGALSPVEKSNLVVMLGATPADVSKRAAVLRSVAEDPTLRTAEFNRAFVLMQYFGYMRRNPDDAPDGNFDGLNFWLAKLNQFNGNFVNAEMVKAFITSIEYRQRFGP
jgi:uncharacterized repeat protein (TIGR01451 family)